MQSNGYTERLLVTDNTKKAAVLLTFGARLRRHQPLTWVNEFANRAEFLALWNCDRQTWRDQKKKPKINVSFNFEPESVDARGVLDAFDSDANAEEEFSALLQRSGVEPALVTKLLEAHSKAVVQGAREALEAREYLVKEHMQKCPETSKLHMVRGKGKTFAMFGTQASKATMAEHLSKIEDV
jgi:hypothetical protein